LELRSKEADLDLVNEDKRVNVTLPRGHMPTAELSAAREKEESLEQLFTA